MFKTSTIGAYVKSIPGPTLPAMFARYRYALDEELRALIPVAFETESQADHTGEADVLYRMLRYHMGWTDEKGDYLTNVATQGKALRPTLCLFSCEALTDDWYRALPAAAALEFIHNFSLIHDDIQDGDLERRHQPTVWALWGQPQALVAGNVMRSLADVATLKTIERGVEEEKALRASFLLTSAYLEMTQGQCLDLAFESSLEITIEDYIGMISCKTGALIRCGMELGSLIGSGDDKLTWRFRECGNFLGLAFQIRDDVLGIWGDEATTGKAVGNDIRRKKKSFPIVYALQTAGDVARSRMVRAYSQEQLEDSDVDDVLGVLDDLHAADFAQQVIGEQAGLALDAIEDVPLPPWAVGEVHDLVEFLAGREY